MEFRDPLFLLLIPLCLVAAYFFRKIKISAPINFSTEDFLREIKPTRKTVLSRNLYWLRLSALLFLAVALARPQSVLEESRIETEGIDIVLALDVSTSMLAEDFKLSGSRVNRLEAVKNVVSNFIKGRQNDRIGLVAFAARAYTVSPLTLDSSWLLQNLERVKIGMIEDGTAVGLGLSSSLNRLKDTRAKSKIVVLLTDGRNNAGDISPSLAAETASALGIKVYTIGAGTKGLAPYPARDFFGNKIYQSVKIEIDEESLIAIAVKTGGRYFRATDTESLREIYSEIDRMEKTPIREQGYMKYKELFPLFLTAALLFLLGEIVLSNTWLRRIP
ncbi:MAG: VWA domain-containing protein [Candidatus Omnitrophota bacterium]